MDEGVKAAGGGLLDGVRWRLIGPFRAGRVVAVAGDPRDQRTFYFGSTGGGVWKTRDGGLSWRNVSDGFFRRASVGALAVAAADPNVVYAGMGECCIRSNVSHGDGVYRSTDAGATWTHCGLAETRHIGRVRVHPSDPDLVYAAALGHAHGPNDERGVYRSRDGGRSWQLIQHRGPDAGAVDLVLDPHNPRIVYATFWQTRRLPWRLDSGGPGSGLWRSNDGGDTWTDISRRPGLPTGTLGRIGIAASPARAGRLWAIVEAEDGALFRSDDHGEHWERLSEQGELRWRAWYYQHVFADPRDADTVWALNIDIWRSIDGGRTFTTVPVPHGDAHDLWFDPTDSRRLILGHDGGANVSYDGGASWSSCFNQPTAELYHVTTDTRDPYRVYAAQQDNTTISVPSHSDLGAITQVDLYDVGGGESGYIAVRPDDPDVVFAGNYLGSITRYDHRSRSARPINVWPESTIGAGAAEARHRFNWTAPIMLSPHDPNVLYQAGNRVFVSRDEGQSWTPISPDLTRADPGKLESSGGELTADNTGAEYYCTVFALAESPLQAGVLWAGTDDGLVHVTRDGGATWLNVTPPDLPEWSHVSIVEPSPHDAGTAYVAAERHRLDDFRPLLWRTRDYGASWERLDAGLPEGEFCRVIREDPIRRDLLYCGTEAGVYVSYDSGASWLSLRGSLPVVPVHDLVVKGDDLVAATHGRSIWILDDLPAVRQREAADEQATVHLYAPRTSVRRPSKMSFTSGQSSERSFRMVGPATVLTEFRPRPGEHERDPVLPDAGENQAAGVTVLYLLRDPGDHEVRLTFLDGEGGELRAFSAKPGEDVDPPKPEPGQPREPRPSRKPGLNRFVWDTRHAAPAAIRIDPPKEEGAWAQAQGPVVPPGTYQVRLEVGDEVRTASFEIVKDSRNPVSQEDLEAQYRHARRLWSRLTELNEAVNTIRELKR
ncbi:MAG TPA: glycosyl hydrolase, partial [Candidatus Dormibacteraeota bacterium]|nr:glycosyl hydrolase [Candidatus Dormibacteraeota bacterium]